MENGQQFTKWFCGPLLADEFLQTEISKRLNAIIAQVVPYLSQEHQQQVATAVDRAKQITMTELNAVIGQQRPDLPRLLQQMHAQQLPGHAGAPPMPLGMPHPSLAPGALGAAAAAAAGAAGGPLGLGQPPAGHPLAIKQDPHRPEETKSNSGLSVSDQDRHVSRRGNRLTDKKSKDTKNSVVENDENNGVIMDSRLQRSSISPAEREKYRPRSPDAHELKKVKKEEKDGHVSSV